MPVDPLGAELKSLRDRIYALERRGMYPPAVADSSWQVVSSFTNSWTNFPTGGWPTAAYRMDSEGWIQMRGLLTGGASGTSAFTLPAAYRPTFAQAVRVNAADQAGYAVIQTDGTVTLYGPSVTHVSLGQISFPKWGTKDLTFQKIAAPQWLNDASLRLVRMVRRRSSMWELVGISGPWATTTVPSLNGNGPDLGDIYGIHSTTAAPFFRAALLDNTFAPTVANLTNLGILGGIRWPDPSIEPLYSDMTLLNGWANFGWGTGNYWGPARYYKDSNGYVHLRGLVKNAGGTSTTIVAQLPAGFRPVGRTMFSTWGAAGHYGFEVDSSGNVSPRNATDRSAVSLAGISFLAEN